MNRKFKESDTGEGPVLKRQKSSDARIDHVVTQQMSPMDIFGLNGDCLREIFKYCNCVDLYQLCVSSDKLKAVVWDYGISGRLIDFGELVTFSISCSDVFKHFGGAMTNIKIAEENFELQKENASKFDEILLLISTHCEMDKLKSLNLQYDDDGTNVSKRCMYAVLPFLRDIESFVISEKELKGNIKGHDCLHRRKLLRRLRPLKFPTSVNVFIDCVIANAVKLQSLEIRNVRFAGTFFSFKHVLKLEKLVLDVCYINRSSRFMSFMIRKPRLKSFSWLHSYTPVITNAVHELVTDNIPDLEEFHYHPDASVFYDYDSRADYSTDPIYNYEILLTGLKNLRALTIDNISDRVLGILVQKNSVQELCVLGSVDDKMCNRDLGISNYTNLERIKVVVNYPNDKKFYMECLPRLPCLTRLQLDFGEAFDDQFSVELYLKLLIRFTDARLNPKRRPLTICIEGGKEWVENLLSQLGEYYNKNLIAIRAAA